MAASPTQAASNLVRYRAELIHDGRRYFPAYAILAVEPIVLVPLLLVFMSAAQLGALGAVEALVVALCGLTQLGVKFAYLQHVVDVDVADRHRGFWTATALTCGVGLLGGALAAPLLDAPWATAVLGLTPGCSPLTLGGLLGVTNLQMMLVTDLRARRNPWPFVFSSTLRLAVMLLLVVWLGPQAASPIEAVLLAQALALAASSLLLAALVRMPGRPCLSWKLARGFLTYGWPIALGNAIRYGTDALLPWLCLALVSPSAAGAMALAVKVSAIFDSAFGQPFLMAWGGRAYVIAGDKAVRRFFPGLFRDFIVAHTVAAVLAWFAGLLILAYAVEEASLSSAASGLLPLAILGRTFFALHFPASVGFLADRDMRWNLWVALAKAGIFGLLGPVGFWVAGAVGGWLVFLCGDLGALVYVYRRGLRLIDRMQRVERSIGR